MMGVHCTTLNWPESVAGVFVTARGAFKRNSKMRRCAMGIALEVNFALWIMIGCGLIELAQYAEYLN
jgi:hypothetical protein